MAHYCRWLKYGSPTGGGCLKGEPMAFFLNVVLRHEADECLIWPFARTGDGYAQLHMDGARRLVHRKACEARHGPPPTERHEAAHQCGNGHLGCVAPAHLFWKTPAENQADRVRHGTSNRGERQWLAKLTVDQVRQIRALKDLRTQTDIADAFGVSSSAVRYIHQGKTWGWLDDYSATLESAN